MKIFGELKEMYVKCILFALYFFSMIILKNTNRPPLLLSTIHIYVRI